MDENDEEIKDTDAVTNYECKIISYEEDKLFNDFLDVIKKNQ